MPSISTDALDNALHVSAATPADTVAATPDSVIIIPASADGVVSPFDATLDTARLQALFPAGYSDTLYTAVAAVPAAWESGLEPVGRDIHPGKSTVFISVIALLFVVMTFSFRTIGRLLRFYGEELVNVRRGRDNVFDDRPTGDTRVLVLLVIQFVVSAGILLAGGISVMSGAGHALMTPVGVAGVIGIVGLYYIFELAAYTVVGYTFASTDGRREWLRGFNASQALLGVVLAVPAILVIFYPATIRWMTAFGLLGYFMARLFFISKGFRIFYDKIGSLLYFILYLCTLEIIPVIITCLLAVEICVKN